MRNSSSAQLFEMQKRRAEPPLRLLAGAVTGTQSGAVETETSSGTLHFRVARWCHWLFIRVCVWCRHISQLCALLPQHRSMPSAVGSGGTSAWSPHSPAVCTQMWLSWNVRWCFHLQLGLENCCPGGHEAGPIVKSLLVIIAKSGTLILHRLKCCLHSVSPSTSQVLLQGKWVCSDRPEDCSL